MHRRDFLRSSACFLTSLAGGAEPGLVHLNATTKSWLLANALVKREIAFDSVLGLRSRRFVDKRSGYDWISPRSRGGSEIFLIVEDDVLYGASPADRFHYIDHEILENTLRIRLQLAPRKLNVDLFYRMFADSAFIEQ